MALHCFKLLRSSSCPLFRLSGRSISSVRQSGLSSPPLSSNCLAAPVSFHTAKSTRYSAPNLLSDHRKLDDVLHLSGHPASISQGGNSRDLTEMTIGGLFLRNYLGQDLDIMSMTEIQSLEQQMDDTFAGGAHA
ncbi:hypothetical protein V2J09_004031 [Rumex salicifolius]